MTPTETTHPAMPPFTPTAPERLPMPDCSKRHDPVIIEPNDGLTQEERLALAHQAFEDLQRDGTYDCDFVLRMREFDRQQSALEMRS